MFIIREIYKGIKYLYAVYIKHTRMSIKMRNSYGELGYQSKIELPCILDNNRKLIEIGNKTIILKNSRLQLYPQLVDTIPHIKIGNQCYFGYNISILSGADIVIGDGVLIASNVLITSENHGINPESDIYYMDQPLECKSVFIGDGSWIGEKVCILPGVTIGVKCIIGAGSIVTKSVPDYCIAVGNPAKVIKTYDFKNNRWEKVK